MEDLIKSVFRGLPRKWYEGNFLFVSNVLIFFASLASTFLLDNIAFMFSPIAYFVITVVIVSIYEYKTNVIIEKRLKKLDIKSLVALYNSKKLNYDYKCLTLKVLNEIHPGWEKKLDVIEIQDNFKKDSISVVNDAENIDSDTLLSNIYVDKNIERS